MKYTLVHSAFLTGSELPTKVANFYYEDGEDVNSCLDDIFRRSQNIEGSWSQGEKYTFGGKEYFNSDYSPNMELLVELKQYKDTEDKLGLRSTSVGDHIVVDGDIYLCDNWGWNKVDKVKGDYRD